MSIQEEIHNAMKEIQKKINAKEQLSRDEIESLFLTSLIEEEG